MMFVFGRYKYGVHGDGIMIHPKPYFIYLRVTGFWVALADHQDKVDAGNRVLESGQHAG